MWLGSYVERVTGRSMLEDVHRIAEDLRQVAVERKASHEHERALAQRRKNPVLRREGGARRDRHRFLTGARAVESYPSLPLQLHHPLVEAANTAHVPVQSQPLAGREGRTLGGVTVFTE